MNLYYKMEYTDIFHNDFMIATFIDIMTPQMLYFYRLVSKYTYEHITMNTINNKIIDLVMNQLKYIYDDKYNDFLTFLEKGHLSIEGPFINHVIWGTTVIPTLLLCMNSDDLDKEINIFKEYKKFDIETLDINMIDVIQYFNYEYEHNYGLSRFKKYSVDLCIQSDDLEDDYPSVFKNKLTIKNHQPVLYIDNMFQIMYKKQPIDLSKDDYNVNTILDLCKEYQVLCYYVPFKDYVEEYSKFIISCKINNDIEFTMLDHYFKNSRLQCDPIKIINNDKIDSLYIDVLLRPFTSECGIDSCPFNILKNVLPINHFHSCVFLKGTEKYVAEAIVLEYHDINVFSNHTAIFNLKPQTSEMLTTYCIDKCSKFLFPPKVHPCYYGLDIPYYKRLFNYSFDEGEYNYKIIK